jgi:hypothetical protein
MMMKEVEKKVATTGVAYANGQSMKTNYLEITSGVSF